MTKGRGKIFGKKAAKKIVKVVKKGMTFSKPKIKSWIMKNDENDEDEKITRINDTAYQCFDKLLTYFINNLCNTICENADSKSINCISVKEAFEDFMNSEERFPDWQTILKSDKNIAAAAY
jgi:hypothetical protein